MPPEIAAPGENVVPITSELDEGAIAPFPEVDLNNTRLEDREFLRALKRLKCLSGYVSQVCVGVAPDVRRAALLGGLNQLGQALRSGRRATFLEWTQVEQRTQVIWSALSEQQRRKFLTTQAPGWLSWVISLFIMLAASALVVAYLIHTSN